MSVSILPGPAALTAGQSAQFTAKVVGTTNTAVKWSMTPNVGSLAQRILYRSRSHRFTANSQVDRYQRGRLDQERIRLPGRESDQAPSFAAEKSKCQRVAAQHLAQPRAKRDFQGQGERDFRHCRDLVFESLARLGRSRMAFTRRRQLLRPAQTVTVTATSVADPAASARATIVLQPVELTIQPASVSLGAAASATFAASVTGTSDTAVTWSLSSAVGTVVNGVYTAPATIGSAQTVTLKAASVADPTKFAMATITLTPAPAGLPGTPHFGNDGSQLTSYVPGKSMFVRSLFFSLVPQLSQYVSAFKAAQLNTLESGFYPPPKNNFSSATKWEAYFQWFGESYRDGG